jgi:asparagine synthase (glutamine-hydrolysing)
LPAASREQALSACDSWDWQERQAKKIVNSVRVYEFWGYSWRIPLWDAEMMDWWERVDPLRDGTVLYDTYVRRQGRALGLPPRRSQPAARKLRSLLRGVVDRIGGLHHARATIHWNEYQSHYLALYGLIPPERFQEVAALPTPIVYYMAMNRLQEIQRLFPQGAP